MRFWAVLFSLLICWSTFVPQPVMASEPQSCCQKSEASGKEASGREQEQSRDCCEDLGCNPFRVCCCCSFLVGERITIRAHRLFPEASPEFHVRDISLLSSYAASSFHPPEYLFA